MYSSITIANYFLRRGWDEQIGISPLKILKLVYVAHGWYLGALGEPLIREPIMAWRYGPIIPALYHHVRKYRSKDITAEIRSSFRSANEETVGDTVRPFLNGIWDHYKDFTALEMSALTHQKGTPWEYARAGFPKDAWGSRTIPLSNAIIEDYYKSRMMDSTE